MSLRLQKRFAAVAFRFHLFFHRVLNLRGRNDIFQFDTVDLDTPFVGSLVKNLRHFSVYCVTGSQRSVKFEFADDVTECCCGKIFERGDGIDGAVSIKFCVKNAEIYNGIYLHCNVILCDNGLRRRIEYLLFERHSFCDAFKERHFDMNACRPCCFVLAEKFNNIFRRLRNDFEICQNDQKNHCACDNTDNCTYGHRKNLFSFHFYIRATLPPALFIYLIIIPLRFGNISVRRE